MDGVCEIHAGLYVYVDCEILCAVARMMAITVFLWMRTRTLKTQLQSAVPFYGLIILIAAYLYSRIFSSWMDSYSCSVSVWIPSRISTSVAG